MVSKIEFKLAFVNLTFCFPSRRSMMTYSCSFVGPLILARDDISSTWFVICRVFCKLLVGNVRVLEDELLDLLSFGFAFFEHGVSLARLADDHGCLVFVGGGGLGWYTRTRHVFGLIVSRLLARSVPVEGGLASGSSVSVIPFAVAYVRVGLLREDDRTAGSTLNQRVCSFLTVYKRAVLSGDAGFVQVLVRWSRWTSKGRTPHPAGDPVDEVGARVLEELGDAGGGGPGVSLPPGGRGLLGGRAGALPSREDKHRVAKQREPLLAVTPTVTTSASPRQWSRARSYYN